MQDRAKVKLAEAVSYPFITMHEGSTLVAFLREQLEMAGQRLPQRIQLYSFDSICRMVQAGVGVGVIPDSAARRGASQGLRVVELDEPWVRERKLLLRDIDALPGCARELIAQIQEARDESGNTSQVTETAPIRPAKARPRPRPRVPRKRRPSPADGWQGPPQRRPHRHSLADTYTHARTASWFGHLSSLNILNHHCNDDRLVEIRFHRASPASGASRRTPMLRWPAQSLAEFRIMHAQHSLPHSRRRAGKTRRIGKTWRNTLQGSAALTLLLCAAAAHADAALPTGGRVVLGSADLSSAPGDNGESATSPKAARI